MSATPRDKLIAMIQQRCMEIPERTLGYREELLAVLADIVRAERDHQVRSTDIQIKVTGYCERLGDSMLS